MTSLVAACMNYDQETIRGTMMASTGETKFVLRSEPGPLRPLTCSSFFSHDKLEEAQRTENTLVQYGSCQD